MVREEPVFFRGTRVGDAGGVFGRNFGRALVEVEAPAAPRVVVEFVGPQGDPGLGGLVLAEGRLRVPQDPREARLVAGLGPGALGDRAVADLLDEAREPVLGLAAVREADPSEVLDSLADERVDGRRDERLLPLELGSQNLICQRERFLPVYKVYSYVVPSTMTVPRSALALRGRPPPPIGDRRGGDALPRQPVHCKMTAL